MVPKMLYKATNSPIHTPMGSCCYARSCQVIEVFRISKTLGHCDRVRIELTTFWLGNDQCATEP